MPPVWTGVEKIGEAVFAGGDLVVGVGSIGSDTVADSFVVSSGDLLKVGSVLEAIGVSFEGDVVDSAVTDVLIGFSVDASEIRLLIVGGKGFGIGFSTGLVRPPFISCNDGILSTSFPLFV